MLEPRNTLPIKHIAVVIDLEFALPWHQDCYQGVMRYGEEQGWRCSLDLYAAGLDGDLTKTSYDGVVGRIPVEVAERVAELGVPMVNLTPYVESNSPDQVTNLPGVYVDREPAIRLAAEHLTQAGYRRLGAMASGGSDREPFLQSARLVCEELGMQWVEPFSFPLDAAESVEKHASTIRTLNRWLAALDKPIGLMVSRTTNARQVAHACIEQGLRVPEDIGIVTPIGDRLMLLSSSPTISGVDYDYYRQGYEAAAMLDTLMAGESIDRHQVWIAPTELVVRESTDVFLCEDKLVSQAMRYIAAHVREDISVQALADAMAVSRSTLLRRFDEALGRSPRHEIDRLRVDYLKRLLTETKTPIAQVGFSCGFSTASHFARYFKREVGVTPSAYRRRMNYKKQD